MQIILDDAELLFKLQVLAGAMTHTLPLTKGISNVLVSHTLRNFQAQGRPAWAGLSPKTIANYRRQGWRVNSILQKTGNLKGSVKGWYTADTASVGAGSAASEKYAAIHQWGSIKKNIPARPYIPMTKDGNVQPECWDTIEDKIDWFWQNAL